MGYAARANSRSFEGTTDERAVLNARLARFGRVFQDRASADRYLQRAGITDPAALAYLSQFLPPVSAPDGV